DFALAAFQGIGRNAIVSHEAVERLARDAAEAGTGHPESLQLTIVKTTDDGLLTDFTDFGGFASRKNGLHASIHPLLAGGQSHKCAPARSAPRVAAEPKSSLFCPSLLPQRLAGRFWVTGVTLKEVAFLNPLLFRRFQSLI